MSHIPEPDKVPVPHFTPCSSEHFLKVKPRYSVTLTQLPRKSVTRNSLNYFDLPPPSIQCHKLRCTNSGAISGFGCSFYLSEYTEIFCSVGCAYSWLLLSTLQLYRPLHAKNWTYKITWIHVHSEFLFTVHTAGRNRAAVGDAVTGAVRTLSDEMPVLIKSSSKCQRPSWNRFLKVIHEANLSHSYTLPSTQLI